MSLLPAVGCGQATEGEALVAEVRLNTLPKGEFFVFQAADGHFWVRTADLEAMGLHSLRAESREVEGEPHVDLGSVEGLRVSLDPATLALEIVSESGVLGPAVVDLGPRRRGNVERPQDTSAFLNYRFGLFGTGAGQPTESLYTETGIRWRNWLALSDFSLVRGSGGTESVRLMSSLSYDRRDDLQRLTLGDFQSYSGELGSGLTMGGISLSKRYDMDPYLLRNPGATLAGSLALPATAEIFLEGVRVGSVPLAPGDFELRNLSSYGGARDMRILLTDALGRQQVIDYDVYFTEAPLRQGLHEYSYDLGLMREDFGETSNRYGDWAASAFHRYGLTDWLTLGVRGEAKENFVNYGGSAILRSDWLGVLSTAWARSEGSARRTGEAYLASYEYRSGGFSFNLMAGESDRGFSTLGSSDGLWLRPREELAVGLGYGNATLGGLGLSYRVTTPFEGPERRVTGLRYSRALTGNLNLSVGVTRTEAIQGDMEVFCSVTWYPGKNISVGYSQTQQDDASQRYLLLSRNPPVDEGFGYRVSLEENAFDRSVLRAADGSLQYNGRHGIYGLNYRRDLSPDAEASYDLSVAGGIGVVGGQIGLSRPITDSFALVQVGDVPGVRVYQNSQEVGQTDAAGRLFVPNLGSYVENTITINDKDIPIEYALNEKEKYIDPPWRSGSVVRFPAQRIQAFTGYLILRDARGVRPAEFCELSLTQAAGPVAIPTGRGGEFYAENLEAGTHAATLACEDGTCALDLTVPQAEGQFVELGEVSCERH